MNNQPFSTPDTSLAAMGNDEHQPLPTIEPGMLALLADIDDPVVDAPSPGMNRDAQASEPLPVAVARAQATAQHLLPAQEAPAEEEFVALADRPISSVMERTLWTVHAEDSIEKVEEILSQQELASAPVVGSNGAIVGMIGQQELTQFHAEGKNAKAVQAWEISRIRTFEVSPGDSVEDVAKLMVENKIENISVTECGRLQGIVSAQDLLLDILNERPESSGK